MTLNSRDGYDLCKTEVSKKQKYTEIFKELLTDLQANKEESVKLIEQDYDAFKTQLISLLDSAKDKLCKKAEAHYKVKAADIEKAIENLSQLKDFSDIEKSQKDKAGALRKEVESCTVADEALFHSMYNCVNIFVHEAKLAKSSTQEIEETRRQFKSKKFEMLSSVFQDYQQAQIDDFKKLQDTLGDVYDQTKKTETKTTFKQKIDHVFNKNLEVQQMDTIKAQEVPKLVSSQLVVPVRHNPSASNHSSEPLIKLVLILSSELGTVLDSSRAHSITSVPVVAAMLSEELQLRKANQILKEKRERTAREEEKREPKTSKIESSKPRSQPKTTKYDIFKNVSVTNDPFKLYSDDQPSDGKPSMIQLAKSVIYDHKQAEKASRSDRVPSEKEAVVDKLIDKLSKFTQKTSGAGLPTKKLERLSDLVTSQKPSGDIYEAVYGLKGGNKSENEQVPQRNDQRLGLGTKFDNGASIHQEKKRSREQYSRENAVYNENPKEMYTKGTRKSDDQGKRNSKENQRRDDSRDNSQHRHHTSNLVRSHQIPEHHTREGRENISHTRNNENDSHAMKVIQTFVVDRPANSRQHQQPPRAQPSNLSKRAPEVRSRNYDQQDEVVFKSEDSSVLQPVRGNLQPHVKGQDGPGITPDCKVLPFKLNRSKKDAMTHANHSEYQLSKGNSFYFTGKEPADFIEVMLQKEAFISTLLIEPPKLSSDFKKNLSKVNGAYVCVQKNGRWERLATIDFKDQKQVILPINMRASVFRIAHGNRIDEDTALGVGKLIVMG